MISVANTCDKLIEFDIYQKINLFFILPFILNDKRYNEIKKEGADSLVIVLINLKNLT